MVRLADGRGMEPVLRAGDFVYVDPDEPAEPGRYVAARLPETGETAVRRLDLEGGRRVLRGEDPELPDVVPNADNETMIVGVVVFSGRRV